MKMLISRHYSINIHICIDYFYSYSDIRYSSTIYMALYDFQELKCCLITSSTV